MLNLLYLSDSLKQAHDGITLPATSARCVWVNNPLTAMPGAGNREAITGISITRFITPEKREEVFDQLLTGLPSEPFSLPHSLIVLFVTRPADRCISVDQMSGGNTRVTGYLSRPRKVRVIKIIRV